MRQLLLTTILGIMTSLIMAQNASLVWAISMGGLGACDGNQIGTDEYGNVYVAGNYSSTVDFAPGAAVVNLSPVFGTDNFVAKYSENGNLIWARSIGGDDIEDLAFMEIDSEGNVIFGGSFGGNADFDPGQDTAYLSAWHMEDIYICKLNSQGDFVWVRHLKGNKQEFARLITLDSEDNIYIAGFFSKAIDVDPGPGKLEFVCNASSNWETFIIKLDENGDLLWGKHFESDINFSPSGIAIDSTNTLIFVGSFSGTADFNPGTGVHNVTATNYNSLFLCKLNLNGKFLSVKVHDPSYGIGIASVVLSDSNYLYITGSFNSTVDFDPGPGVVNKTYFNSGHDGFVWKLTTEMDYKWVEVFPSTLFSGGEAIFVDEYENAYITGFIFDKTTFESSSPKITLVSKGQNDAFLAKIDKNGNWKWAGSFGDQIWDQGNDIHVDESGYVYSTGGFNGIVDLDPFSGTQNASAGQNTDVYFNKIRQWGVGIPENNSLTRIKAFPNPTNDFITIDLLNVESRVTIEIREVTGRVISTKQFAETDQVKLLMPELPGLYFVDVKRENAHLATLKVIRTN